MTTPVESKRPYVTRRYLIDNSVWQRQNQPAVRKAMDQLLAPNSPWAILTCPEIVAEVGFSARNGRDHDLVRSYLRSFPECEVPAKVAQVLDIQNALFNNGLFRAVGSLDTVIAAYAIANDAIVVHYDADFEHVARVRPDLRHTWIAPRGSLAA